MPNIKAAEKWVRQSEKRALRNRDAKTRLKTLYKKAVAAGDGTNAAAVESQLDKAAQKGIIHPNKAARKKSRLARARAGAAGASTTATAQPAAKSARKKTVKR